MGLHLPRFVFALAVYGLLATIPATASEPPSALQRNGGASFSLPEGWRARESQDGAFSLWVHQATGATISLVSHDRYTEVSAARMGSAKEEIERRMAGRRGIKRFQVEGLTVAPVDGLLAYRLQASLELEGRRVRELQYIVSGRETFLLTFSSLAGSFDEDVRAFEQVISSVRVLDRPGIAQRMPAELCCGLLGAVAGLGSALKRKRSRRK